MSNSEFYIYNASAGSGKTFALVKFYLKTLFSSNYSNPHRKILSLTFTNKAVNEMKSRIIKALFDFSKEEIIISDDPLFKIMRSELDWSAEQLHKQAKIHLRNIIHDYSFFEVMTIDTFNQRLIRNFSRDLGLNTNFDIELDSKDVLALAVDNLITKAGTDKELTDTLIGFALEKSDDDKSFNIAYDFNKMAEILINENHFSNLRKLDNKTLDDFISLKDQIIKKLKSIEGSINNIADSILQRFEELELKPNNFFGGSVPRHFMKLSRSDFNIDFNKVWMQTLDTKPLYKTKTDPEVARLIDGLQPDISKAFNLSRELIGEYHLCEAIYKNLIPLSVLHLIHKEVDLIKAEQNMVLISEFNPIVAEHLQDQPAAFIYERIGERYKNFFIDEFQDTSVLQWKNLIPLVGNSLSSENAKVMIVGDAKQSIYRWRGGKPEQFIGLYDKSDKPFTVEQSIHSLEWNYRSHKEIVEFNNDFFTFLADVIFDRSPYGEVYKKCVQQPDKSEKGYVNLSFVEFEKVDSSHEIYGEGVLNTIDNCLDKGFDLNEICILTRKREQGRALARYLSMNSDYEVVSDESLLLSQSPEVRFIMNMLQFLIDPANLDIKFQLLDYLSGRFEKPENCHAFIHDGIGLDENGLERYLETFSNSFLFSSARVLPIYEAIEYIIDCFGIMPHTDAYLQGLLELVHERSKNNSLTIHGFLDYFNEKCDDMGISLPSGIQAIQLMTIHQAKGLEFPVVIFPYADLDLYYERDPKLWVDLDKNQFNDFSSFYINFNKRLNDMGEWGEELYRDRRDKLEFDTVNLLYVAFTRAIQHLYILCRKKLKADGEASINSSDGLLIQFLQNQDRWSDSAFTYEFGTPTQKVSSGKKELRSDLHKPFRIVRSPERQVRISTHSGLLWDSRQENALEKGNLIHQIMADIIRSSDVSYALDKALSSGLISTDQEKTLSPLINEIVEHPDLFRFFSSECKVYSERSILLADGNVIRPDRISILPDGQAVLIDYKTGKSRDSHMEQIYLYSDALNKMGIEIHKRFLIYVDQGIEVKEV